MTPPLSDPGDYLAAGSLTALTGAVDRFDRAHGRDPRRWRLAPSTCP
ncbi:hypothetical protein [Rhodococcus sp. NCIMB 12038]|nr:hypothetical protein [Rhodococcus sp. NCIMB 12038]